MLGTGEAVILPYCLLCLILVEGTPKRRFT